jgi:hypothetical protein
VIGKTNFTNVCKATDRLPKRAKSSECKSGQEHRLQKRLACRFRLHSASAAVAPRAAYADRMKASSAKMKSQRRLHGSHRQDQSNPMDIARFTAKIYAINIYSRRETIRTVILLIFIMGMSDGMPYMAEVSV